MISLATVEHTTFAAVEGESFRVATPEASIEVKLAEVRVLGHSGPTAGRDPFALDFLGPPGLRLPQGIYRFEHATVGAMEIFITQTGDGPEGSQFEAVFT